MPEVALAFRAVCGGFVPVFIAFMFRRFLMRRAMYFRPLKMYYRRDGVAVGLLLAYLYLGVFLHRCGDVELNPGPISPPIPGPPGPPGHPGPGGSNMRQTRLMSGTGGGATLRRSSSPSSQTSGDEPTLKDLMASQKVMMESLNNMNSKFDVLSGDVRDMKDMFSGLAEEVSNLRAENKTLIEENERLTERVEWLERKTDDLEGHSKRNNVIFYGVHREQNETNEECEERVKEMLTDKLDLSTHREVEFDRLHRLNRKPDSPIIARCTFYETKVAILGARHKLKGTKVFISEDFSSRVREIRKKLLPHLKEARKENKRAAMVYDHLIIEGKRFCLDQDQNLKAMQ